MAGSSRKTVRFAYEILNDATGDLLATGETVHVICDRQGRPKRCPKNTRKYFPAPGTKSGNEAGKGPAYAMGQILN